MIRHLVFLDDALDELTDEDLYPADFEDGVLSAMLTRERGVQPSFTVTMAHPGWDIFKPGNRRGAALVTSEDGTLATATVHARGWLRNLMSSLTGDEVTLIFECRPEDDDDADALLEAAAKAVVQADMQRPGNPFKFTGDGTAKAAPYRDLLFGRMQKLSDEVMLARSAWWRYDPVTHEVTMVENRDPARIRHNIGDGYDPETLRVSEGDGAVSEVTMTVVVNMQVSSTGVCNLAPLIGSIDTLMGYSGSAPASLGANTGWTFGTPLTEHVEGATQYFYTGREWQYVTRKMYYVTTAAPGGQTVTNTTYGASSTRIVRQEYRVERHSYSFISYPATWGYSQTRREKAKLTLRVPCQQVGGIRRTLDLGELNLQSLYTPVVDTIADVDEDDETTSVQAPVEMQDAQPYQAGDYAYYAGKLYRAQVNNPGPLYVVRMRRLQVETTISPNWADTGIMAPVADRSLQTFFPTARGKAVAAHAFRRMAKAAIARLSTWRATLTIEREYLPEVELEDEILILLPSRWDEPQKICIGQVVKVEETWAGEGDTVTVTLAVATGTGLDEQAAPAVVGSFATAGFGSGFAKSTSHVTAGGDVEFALAFGGLDERVDLRRLSDPTYVLRGLRIDGQADEQLAEVLARAQNSKDPVPPNTSTPTMINLAVVPLISERLIDREVTGTGDLLYSPRGIDLSE